MTWYVWKWWRLALADSSTAHHATDADGTWARVVGGFYVLTRRRP
jgi:hypothetical protein